MKTLFIAFAVACSVPPHETPNSAPAPPQPGGPIPHEALEHSTVETGPTLDPATACGRAQACCRAFAAATPHVVAADACAETVEVAEADDADERCERMRTGWRVALEHNPGADPPTACSD